MQVMRTQSTQTGGASIAAAISQSEGDASSPTAQALRRDGYATIADIADQEDIDTIFAALHRIHRDRMGVAEGMQFDLVGDGNGAGMSFPQIFGPSDFAPELLRTKFFRAASELAKDVLGPDARFGGDHALLKKAHRGPKTPWHQDEAFRNPAFESDEISIWLALRDTTPENGCLEFIPGSHLGEILEHRRLGDNPKVHALECIGDFDASTRVACPIRAGSVTVHTSRTLHHAGPNTSEGDRVGYVLMFEKLVPRPVRNPKPRPWLAATTARAEREKAWKKKTGGLGYALRMLSRVRRFDLRNREQLKHVLRMGRMRFLEWLH